MSGILDKISNEEEINGTVESIGSAFEKGIDLDQPSLENDGIEIDLSILKRRTGEGEFDSYKNHMFNPYKSDGMAHILRGLTGIVGTDLNFAIADIAVGIMKLLRNRPKKSVQKVNDDE